MTETKAEKTGFRWSRVVLIISLALNLAIFGIIGGAILRWDAGQDRAHSMQIRDIGFGPYVGALDGDDRRALGRAFVQSAGGPKVARSEVSKRFEEILTILKTEPFDSEAFETLLLAQQSRFSERQEIGAHLVVDHIADMSAEARAAYAMRLDDLLKRPPRPPHDGKGPDGRPDRPKDG